MTMLNNEVNKEKRILNELEEAGPEQVLKYVGRKYALKTKNFLQIDI